MGGVLSTIAQKPCQIVTFL